MCFKEFVSLHSMNCCFHFHFETGNHRMVHLFYFLYQSQNSSINHLFAHLHFKVNLSLYHYDLICFQYCKY